MTDSLSHSLIESSSYTDFIASSHPHLLHAVDPKLGHYFIAPLDIAEPLLPGLLRWTLEKSQTIAPSLLKPRALFLGTPFEPYRQDDVLTRISDISTLTYSLMETSKQHDTQCVVMTNISPTHARITELVENGFVLLPSFPDMVLELRRLDNFESYLGTLKAADRSSVRRNKRVFRERGYTLEKVDDSSQYAKQLYHAYRPFFERAKVKWFPHSLEFFQNATAFGSSTRLFVARDQNGELAGFTMGYYDGKTYHAGRLGVRPDLHHQDRVYFALLYTFIEDAIALNAKVLSLEPTAYRLKRHLGAQPKPVVNAVLGSSLFWKTALLFGKPLGLYLLRHLNRLKLLEANY